MIKLIFDLERIHTKLIIGMLILITFLVINIMIPLDEFGINENYGKVITTIDMLEYSILSQICTDNSKIYPKTLRTKIIKIIHLLLGYGILLI